MATIGMSRTGDITINGKVFNLNNLVFKAPGDIKDIDNNLLLNNLGFAKYLDYLNFRNMVDVDEAAVNAKADVDYVNNLFRNKANRADILLATEIDNIQTIAPSVVGPITIPNGGTATYTIVDYQVGLIYDVSTDIGTVNYTGGNTFVITANTYNVTTSGTVNLFATEPGKIISNPTTINVIVSNITYTSDQLLSNSNYANNASYNDLFQY